MLKENVSVYHKRKLNCLIMGPYQLSLRPRIVKYELENVTTFFVNYEVLKRSDLF